MQKYAQFDATRDLFRKPLPPRQTAGHRIECVRSRAVSRPVQPVAVRTSVGASRSI